jgi:hypothetical protein
MSVLAKNFLTLENTTSAPRSSESLDRSALVADALRQSGGLAVRVRLRVYGESMLPALWPGDVVEIASCSLEDVRPGEIVLARREGRLFLHRFVARCTPDGFLLRGDSMPGSDPVFPAEALLGRLVRSTDEEQGFSAGARRPSFNVKWSSVKWPSVKWLGARCSRTLGMLLCHCGVARRLALKLHRRRDASAREFRDPEPVAELRSPELGSADLGAL